MSAAVSPNARPRRTRKSLVTVTPLITADAEPTIASGIKSQNKKTRSKSIGPGGLEALSESSGNKQKLATVRSILVPTIPLSPPKDIPPFVLSQATSPTKSTTTQSPRRSPRVKSASGRAGVADDVSKGPAHAEPSGETTVTFAEDAEMTAQRQRKKKEIMERRDARRKSLANRRVSFAPEATLHRWDVADMAEDAAESPEGPGASHDSLTSPSQSASHHGLDLTDPPSTPPDESIQVARSPANQRAMHRRQRRRSSGIPPMDFNNPANFSSSPTSSLGDEDTQHSFLSTGSAVIDESSDEDRDLVEREDTVTGVDEDDTVRSSASVHSAGDSSSGSVGQLDLALYEATLRAQMQHTVTTGFNISDQVMAVAQSVVKPKEELEMTRFRDDAVTMEVTHAFGSILPSAVVDQDAHPSLTPRPSSARGRRSSGDSSVSTDETMDLTLSLGTIQPVQSTQGVSLQSDPGDDEQTMEFTKVVGRGLRSAQISVHDGAADIADEQGMDLTAAVGRLLSPVTERTEPTDDETMGMDLTRAVGAILPSGLHSHNKSHAKAIMEEEADHDQLMRLDTSKPLAPVAAPASDMKGSGRSTGLVEKLHDQENHDKSQVQNDTHRHQRAGIESPMHKPKTPSKQMTPEPRRPGTPSKTPPSKNVSVRRGSPKKLFRKEIREISGPSTDDDPTRLHIGFNDPMEITEPPTNVSASRRRLSGLGIDQDGLGSPRIAAMLDRRGSLGDSSAAFKSKVQFGAQSNIPDLVTRDVGPPMLLDQDLEQVETQRGKGMSGEWQQRPNDESVEKNLTANLKDMITSLTPKKDKTKLKGRKSLHVGAAKGLLGKRPRELDEEEDENATPKKLKGVQRSPVKHIRLPAPPSKEETTGRLNIPPRFNLGDVSGNVGTPNARISPTKATTPRSHGRFHEAETIQRHEAAPISLNDQLAGPEGTLGPAGQDSIRLSEFLQMTGIRFMELTSTKRRHTGAPDDPSIAMPVEAQDADDTQCVIASACTLPMLELYQHSCRELKKYIADGRDIVKEIEADTFEENPPLFQEYLEATPDMRAIMDNQLKNVKTHARLRSKAMWYEWRTKLLEGLRDGLLRIGTGFAEDDRNITQQEELLGPTITKLTSRFAELTGQTVQLQQEADELARCDPETLTQVRKQLAIIDEELSAKRQRLLVLQEATGGDRQQIEFATERKTDVAEEIREAERIRDECRGWSGSEIKSLQVRVKEMQNESGWTVTAIQDGELSLSYQSQFHLTLNPKAFAPYAESHSSNAQISLAYTFDQAFPRSPFLARAEASENVATIRRFFLQMLRARLLSLPQRQTNVATALILVTSGAASLSKTLDAYASLCTSYMAEASIIGDESLSVACPLLLRDMRTRVRVRLQLHFGLSSSSERVSDDLRVSTTANVTHGSELGLVRCIANVSVAYGEELKEDRMSEFLNQRISVDGVPWLEAVRELETRLEARGKRAAS